MHWDLYINFLAAMIAIVNPLGIWPVWSELTNDASKQVRQKITSLVVATSFLILIIFLFA